MRQLLSLIDNDLFQNVRSRYDRNLKVKIWLDGLLYDSVTQQPGKQQVQHMAQMLLDGSKLKKIKEKTQQKRIFLLFGQSLIKSIDRMTLTRVSRI